MGRPARPLLVLLEVLEVLVMLVLPVMLVMPACSFDATGLGEGGGGATTQGSGGPGTTSTTGLTTGAQSTEVQPTGTDTQTPMTLSATTAGFDPDTSDVGDESSTTGPQPRCGDGMLDAGEACDDGADNGATRPCTPDCAFNVCGDGLQLAGQEACDDGNQVDNDECRNDCSVTPTCGNSKLDDGEQCDDGNDITTDACVLCIKAGCGDGYVQENADSCDDAGESPTCNADCSLAKCGDTKLNMTAGEVCDLGPQNGAYKSGCGADCSDMGTFCGDGIITKPDENCDPMSPLPGAVCTSDCKALTCNAGRDDCDDKLDNGCEVDLNTDEDNCGSCKKVCAILDCKDGVCKI